jgi:hypothetical protein
MEGMSHDDVAGFWLAAPWCKKGLTQFDLGGEFLPPFSYYRGIWGIRWWWYSQILATAAAVQFEDSPLWDLTAVVGGRWPTQSPSVAVYVCNWGGFGVWARSLHFVERYYAAMLPRPWSNASCWELALVMSWLRLQAKMDLRVCSNLGEDPDTSSKTGGLFRLGLLLGEMFRYRVILAK